MVAGDEKPPSADDEELPAPRKPDVRVSSHDDMGVNVSRDLRSQGPTARGWNTNMSKLNFSARGLPRVEIAEPAPEPVRPVAAPPASSAPAPVAGASAAAPPAPDAGGLLSRLTGLFSRR